MVSFEQAKNNRHEALKKYLVKRPIIIKNCFKAVMEQRISKNKYYNDNKLACDERHKKWCNKNKARKNEHHRIWLSENQDKAEKSRKKYENSIRGKFNYVKKSAKSMGRDFELTENEIEEITSRPCYMCGTKEKVGIDRYFNDIGYLYYNCEACCWKCNNLKSATSFKEFIDHIERIFKNYSN